MNEKAKHSTDTSDREIVATRLYDAPRELVWQAWIDPNLIIHWWGPNGFTNTIEAMDVKPGGVWRFTMHGPDGVDYPNKIVYLEVVKPERIVYSHGSDDVDHPGDFTTIVLFRDVNGKTELSMRMLFQTAEQRNEVVDKYGAVEGLKQTLERLAGQLAKMA